MNAPSSPILKWEIGLNAVLDSGFRRNGVGSMLADGVVGNPVEVDVFA